MMHVTVERPTLADAIALARQLYLQAIKSGRHVLLDTPGDFRTNLPERRLSSADVLITARQSQQPTT